MDSSGTAGKKAKSDQVGRAGEFLVASELNRRGMYATTFSGNVPGFDVLANEGRIGSDVHIQVKTTTDERWCRGDLKYLENIDVFALVSLWGAAPRCFVVPKPTAVVTFQDSWKGAWKGWDLRDLADHEGKWTNITDLHKTWPHDFDPASVYPEGESLPYWTAPNEKGAAVIGPTGFVATAVAVDDAVKLCQELNRLSGEVLG